MTVVISGVSSGIGRAMAEHLLAVGTPLVALVRTDAAAERIMGDLGLSRESVFTADYDDLGQVQSAAHQIVARHKRIDVLINNAGRLPPASMRADDPRAVAVLRAGYLSHYLLTRLLLPSLLVSGAGRVVNVTSRLHRLAPDVAPWTPGGMPRLKPRAAFALAKLSQIALATELRAQYGATGLTACAIHPGIARSNVPEGSRSLLLRAAALFMCPVDVAAARVLRSASEPDPAVYREGKRLRSPDPRSIDPAFSRRLWDWSASEVADWL